MPLVITVQTDGGLNFDKPAPICFPNLPNPTTKKAWPPGTKGSLISFNHDKGVWEDAGNMTVSADGNFFCTDPGVGILQPGWHGPQCPKGKKSPQPPPDCPGIYTNDPEKTKLDVCAGGCGIELNEALAILEKVTLAGHAICNSLRGVATPQQVEDCFNDNWLRANQERANAYQKNADCKQRCVQCFGGPGGTPRPLSFSPRRTNPALANIPEQTDLIGDQLRTINDEMHRLIGPFALSRSSIPAEVINQLDALANQANAVAGGDAAAYIKNRRIAVEEEALQNAVDLGMEPLHLNLGNAPPYSVLYLARTVRPSGIQRLRGDTEPYGQYTLFVPPDGELLDVSFYDPKTKAFGLITPNLSSKVPYDLPRFSLFPLSSDTPDFDKDGIPDLVEEIYGTIRTKADTDGDGIPDGTHHPPSPNLRSPSSHSREWHRLRGVKFRRGVCRGSVERIDFESGHRLQRGAGSHVGR